MNYRKIPLPKVYILLGDIRSSFIIYWAQTEAAENPFQLVQLDNYFKKESLYRREEEK